MCVCSSDDGMQLCKDADGLAIAITCLPSSWRLQQVPVVVYIIEFLKNVNAH